MKKLVIGAGHGANTPGKRTPDGVREWSMNSKVVELVIIALEDYDVEIHRTDDYTGAYDISLSDRVKKANSVNPNLYIEVHHNANTGVWGDWTGFEVYYMRGWQELATRCAATLKTHLKIKPHGDNAVRTSNLAVLRDVRSNIPAVLTEGGYMDSNIDSKYIRSEEGIRDYANGLVSFIISELKLTKKIKEELKVEESKVFEIPYWGVEACNWANANDINDGVYNDLDEVKMMCYLHRYHKLLKKEGLVK